MTAQGVSLHNSLPNLIRHPVSHPLVWLTRHCLHPGSVIFGGIDVKKYSGDLVKRSIISAAQSPDGLTRFWVYLDGISVNQPGGNVVEVYKAPAGGKGQAVLLDSGYTLSALPTAIFNKLVAAFPSAQYVASADLYTVDCKDPGQGGSLDFTFGDKVITVRYYDFVWHYPDSELCVLGAFEDCEYFSSHGIGGEVEMLTHPQPSRCSVTPSCGRRMSSMIGTTERSGLASLRTVVLSLLRSERARMLCR